MAFEQTSGPRLHPIREAVDSFIKDLDSLATAAAISLLMLGMSKAIAESAFNNFIATHYEKEGIDRRSVEIPRGDYEQYNRLHRKFDQARNAIKITPRSFVVSLTSQYDVFLSRLTNAVLILRPEMLASSERKFSFSEIIGYSNIEDIRSGLIDAEIDALLRKSVVEQFAWMETKFSVSLRSDLPAWPQFVELSQRRNLFVHADGIVSRQYLDVCQSQGVDVSGIKIGAQLTVDSAYFRRAHAVLLEIGVKLSQVLWRKLDAETLKEAEQHLNEIAFNLLQQDKFHLSRNLLDFAFAKSMKRLNKETELMLLVNRANAYRLGGDAPKCTEILGNDDWSAYAAHFQLARATLLEDMDQVTKFMKAIGATGSPDKHDYREWPLFKTARKDDRFKQAFAEIFGEPLYSVELDTDITAGAKVKLELEGLNSPAFSEAFRQMLGGDMGEWLNDLLGRPASSGSADIALTPPGANLDSKAVALVDAPTISKDEMIKLEKPASKRYRTTSPRKASKPHV